MRSIIKSVINSVKNKWSRNQWIGTSYKVLGNWYTTRVFLIWHVRQRVSAITKLSNPGLMKEILQWLNLTFNIIGNGYPQNQTIFIQIVTKLLHLDLFVEFCFLAIWTSCLKIYIIKKIYVTRLHKKCFFHHCRLAPLLNHCLAKFSCWCETKDSCCLVRMCALEAITCSKVMIETLEQGMKYDQSQQ